MYKLSSVLGLNSLPIIIFGLTPASRIAVHITAVAVAISFGFGAFLSAELRIMPWLAMMKECDLVCWALYIPLIFIIMGSVALLICSAGAALALALRWPTRKILRTLEWCVGVGSAGICSSMCVRAVWVTTYRAGKAMDAICAIECLMWATMLLSGSIRRRVRWYISRSEAMTAAVAISALLGDTNPAHTARGAEASFRGIPMDKLIREDLDSNVPSDRLHQLTVTCGAGGSDCDVFISRARHHWRVSSACVLRGPRVSL